MSPIMILALSVTCSQCPTYYTPPTCRTYYYDELPARYPTTEYDFAGMRVSSSYDAYVSYRGEYRKVKIINGYAPEIAFRRNPDGSTRTVYDYSGFHVYRKTMSPAPRVSESVTRRVAIEETSSSDSKPRVGVYETRTYEHNGIRVTESRSVGEDDDDYVRKPKVVPKVVAKSTFTPAPMPRDVTPPPSKKIEVKKDVTPPGMRRPSEIEDLPKRNPVPREDR